MSAAIAKHYLAKDDTIVQRHTINDDIESMIYVVLYCALLWLPLKDPIPQDVQSVLNMLDYWTPWKDGEIRGGQLKSTNLEDQSYTRSLEWTVPTIQQWFSGALDQLMSRKFKPSKSKKRTIAKVFHDWWGDFLADCQGSDQNAERFDNTKVKVLRSIFTSKKSAAVMDNVAHQSTISAPGNSSKRPREDAGVASPEEAGPSLAKKPRIKWSDEVGVGQFLPLSTSWRAPKNESIDTIQGMSSWDSNRSSNVFQDLELMEMEGDGTEGDRRPGDPDAYESDPASEADDHEGPTVGATVDFELGEQELKEDEEEVPREIEVTAAKGKGREKGVKGWGP